MARRPGQNVSRTAALVGCSWSAVVSADQKWSEVRPQTSQGVPADSRPLLKHPTAWAPQLETQQSVQGVDSASNLSQAGAGSPPNLQDLKDLLLTSGFADTTAQLHRSTGQSSFGGKKMDAHDIMQVAMIRLSVSKLKFLKQLFVLSLMWATE